MTTTTLERTEGLSVLSQAMAVIKERIEEKRGVFNVQMEVNIFFFPNQRWISENSVNLLHSFVHLNHIVPQEEPQCCNLSS